jgi:hypothetical protein
LLCAWWLSPNWSDFNTRAHGLAAVLMFLFLIGAIIAAAGEHWPERHEVVWFWLYAAVAVLMITGGILLPATRIFAEHTVFALETFEIILFAIYWGIQTAEKWDEKVRLAEVRGTELTSTDETPAPPVTA